VLDRFVERTTLILDAGVAFGSGEHNSTRGCLMALEQVIARTRHSPGRRPRRILDLGTGSGILAMAAAKTSHRKVLATDIEPWSVRVARENARLNHVHRLVLPILADGWRSRRGAAIPALTIWCSAISWLVRCARWHAIWRATWRRAGPRSWPDCSGRRRADVLAAHRRTGPGTGTDDPFGALDDPGASEDGVIRERGFSTGPLSARTSTAQNINTNGRPTMKIGFIGLGIMGRPMALNLKNGGHDLIVPERASLTAEIRAAAEVVADGKSVAAKSEVVVIIVPDTPDVEAVLFGAGGVAEGLKKGTLVIDMSSISPIETKEFAKKINALGCDYVDAPVSGGEVGAKQATLTIMAGGPDAAFARAKPLFDLMGKNITHVGPANGDRPDLQGG
jgi:hypothetical protein